MEKHEEDTKRCLDIENNKEALSCLKKVVVEFSGSNICGPKLVLLVKKGCIPCKEETQLHAEDIAKGIIEKINIDSPEGISIAMKNDIVNVPSLLLLDCNDNIIEYD